MSSVQSSKLIEKKLKKKFVESARLELPEIEPAKNHGIVFFRVSTSLEEVLDRDLVAGCSDTS